MPYTAPTEEQKFVLRHVVEIETLGGGNAYPDLTPDLIDAIVEGAGAFAEGTFAPLNRIGDVEGAKWSADGVTLPDGYREAYQAYVEAGWGSLAGPQQQGGQGLPQVLATLVLEDLGSANMAFSLCPMLSAGAVEALVHHGTAEQQATWLPRLISGEWTGTMNLTEPQAGSDVGALKTRAERQEDGSYRIKGQKIFITWGDHDVADNIVHLVLARLPDAPPGTKGISLFLVPKVREDGSQNDLRCVSIEHKLGIHASPTCVMAFGDGDDCTGELIGPEGGGMRAMFTMMNNARMNVGLQGVSIAELATQQAVNYALGRVQGARDGAPSPIIGHPDVRRMLLRMKALTQGARALAYYAQGQADRGRLGDDVARAQADLLTPLVKAWCTDVGCEVASLGLQVHGGMGFIEETGAAQPYRDIRIAPIYEGTNGIQAADLVGRKLGLHGGSTVGKLIADMRQDAREELEPLLAAIQRVLARLDAAEPDSRLAGSYPLLTMMAVATAGWLMARQAAVAEDGDTPFLQMKRAAARYFLDVVVAEAAGQEAAACLGMGPLRAASDEAFAA